MKLHAAALALSAAALLVDDTAAYYASSAGRCLETVVANVEDGAFDDGAYDGVEWNEAASFYANRNGNANGNYNYYNNNGEAGEADEADAEQQDQQADGYDYNNNNAEQAAQWAENSIGGQLTSLAEYLNIEDDNEDQDANGEEGEDANEANANYDEVEADEDAQAEVEDCQYNQDEFSKFSMPYDAELAEKLGIEDRCSFAQFYELTYNLAESGCQGNYYKDMYDYEYAYNYNQEAQDAEQEQQDEDLNEDGIRKIFQNCQNSYKAIGIYLEEEEVEELMDDETLQSFFTYITFDKSVNDGKLDAYITINDGNVATAFQQFFENGEGDFDEEEQANFEVMWAIKNGEFTKYLMFNLNLEGYYRVEDWETVLDGFFQSIGLENVNVDDLDSYTRSQLYYNVYEVEEAVCEQAMTEQFGSNKAANEGYVEQTSMVDNWLNTWFSNGANNNDGYSWQFGNGSNGSFDSWVENIRNGDNGDDSWLANTVTSASSFRNENGQFTAGAAAGIAIGALAAVALVVLGMFKLGQSSGHSGQASAGRKAPLITDQSNVKTKVYREHTDPSNETGASPVRRFRTFAAFV